MNVGDKFEKEKYQYKIFCNRYNYTFCDINGYNGSFFR